MSWKATAIVKYMTAGAHGERLGMADKFVLLMIAEDWNDGRKMAWSSQELMAKCCLCTPRGLRGILERLERFGLLQIVHRGRLGNQYLLPFMRNGVPQSGQGIEEQGFPIIEERGDTLEEPARSSHPIEPLKDTIEEPLCASGLAFPKPQKKEKPRRGVYHRPAAKQEAPSERNSKPGLSEQARLGAIRRIQQVSR